MIRWATRRLPSKLCSRHRLTEMSVITIKRCGRCRVEKPTAEFGKDRSCKDGLQSRCRSCRSELGRATYVPRPKPTNFPSRWKHVPGDRFAELVIVARVGRTRGGGTGVVVQCDCGSKSKIVRLSNLVSGSPTNCADRANHPDPRFKGDDVTYDGAHNRVKGERGSASDYPCALCGGPAEQWAYRHSDPDQKVGTSGKGKGKGSTYSPDPSHYWAACRSCHGRWDSARRKMLGSGLSLFHAALYLALDKQNGAVA